MLRADLAAPPKQRHTNKRILDRLRDEYGFTVVAYTTLNDYLRIRTASEQGAGGPGPGCSPRPTTRSGRPPARPEAVRRAPEP
ncbi:hypothetical protein ABZ330_35460 [Streptomyces sp. NPDC006172]|uniref:hypothetical protein n=1 Tax=Streptomyces sp. NPDC006172 TaxID=3154470 RepID=UPI0033FBD3A9